MSWRLEEGGVGGGGLLGDRPRPGKGHPVDRRDRLHPPQRGREEGLFDGLGAKGLDGDIALGAAVVREDERPGDAGETSRRQRRSAQLAIEHDEDVRPRAFAQQVLGVGEDRLVPAALAGYDVEELCGRALEVNGPEAVQIGLSMAMAADAGQDKATFVVPSAQRSLGLWLEQLVAESTGKQNKGCVPVPTSEHERGEDRHVIPVELSAAHELGAVFYRFELATAAAGHGLGIDPFDEPNVAESKANTNKVLENLPLPSLASVGPEAVTPWLEEQIKAGDYVSIQAYLPYGSEDKLERLRAAVRDAHGGMAVTAGYGPRFLHSTGQLHKGGPNSVVAVQIVERSARASVAIPDKPYDFNTLIAAQAIGDHQSLESHGRRVLRVALDDLDELISNF